jgi:hypothetical protein
VIWDRWSSYRVSFLLSFFQLFPNSTTGFTSYCLLVGCKYLHLTLSAAFWAFWKAVMICKHTIAPLIVSGLEIFLWAESQFGPETRPPFPQAFLHICLCSSFRQELLWVRVSVCGMAIHPSTWCPCLSTGGASVHCRAFHLMSLPLSPESVSLPRSLVHSRGSLNLLPHKVASFNSFCWPSGLQSGSPQYLIMFPSSPVAFSTRVSPNLPPSVIDFFSFPSGNEAPSLGPFGTLFFFG